MQITHVLNSWSQTARTIDDVLVALVALPMTHGAHVLLSGVNAYVVGTITASGVQSRGRDVTSSALNGVYEARVFTDGWELRWRQDAEDVERRGTAVLLSESPIGLFESWEALDPILAVDVHEFGYVLAGSTAVPGSSGGQELSAREYIAVEPTHGNAYIAEERLLAIRTVTNWQSRSNEA